MHQGFSLLEILLALALSSVVIAAVLSTYLSVQQTAIFIKNRFNLQERAAFLAYLLRTKVNNAGDWHCRVTQPSKQLPLLMLNRQMAYDKLGLQIDSGSKLLQVNGCVTVHGESKFLGTAFYIRKQKFMMKIFGRRAITLDQSVTRFSLFFLFNDSQKSKRIPIDIELVLASGKQTITFHVMSTTRI